MKALLLIPVIIVLAIAVVEIIACWKVYTKAGKPGWAIFIPIYSTLVYLEIIGKPWWWLLILIFVPILDVIFAIWAVNLLSKSFGKGVGFTIGLIILCPIFIPILGFGSAEYKGPAGAQSA